MAIADPPYVNARTRIRESDPAVSATPGPILRPDSRRVAIVFGNLSTALASIGFTSAVTLTKGLPIPPNSGLVSFNMRDHAGLVGQQFFGVSASAITIHIVEIIWEPVTDDE